MTRVFLLVALVLFQPALAMNKCIVNGKTVYQEAECPRGSVQKPIAERVQQGATDAGGSAAPRTSTGGPWPKLPELQRGQWTVEESGGAQKTCGHPLQSLYTDTKLDMA